MRKKCPYCGDQHVCLRAANVSGGSVTPPSQETVQLFVNESTEQILGLLRDGCQFRSEFFFEMYLEWCRRGLHVPLGRRTFNNTLVHLGWERRKIGGYYRWVGFGTMYH